MRKTMKNDEVKSRKTLFLLRESEVLSKSTKSRNDEKKYPKIMKQQPKIHQKSNTNPLKNMLEKVMRKK